MLQPFCAILGSHPDSSRLPSRRQRGSTLPSPGSPASGAAGKNHRGAEFAESDSLTRVYRSCSRWSSWNIDEPKGCAFLQEGVSGGCGDVACAASPCPPSTPLPPRLLRTPGCRHFSFGRCFAAMFETPPCTAASVDPTEGVFRADAVSKQTSPTQKHFTEMQTVVSDIPLALQGVRKLSLLSLTDWDDSAAAPSSGAQSSRITGLILRNAKKCLHKVGLWLIWSLGHAES